MVMKIPHKWRFIAGRIIYKWENHLVICYSSPWYRWSIEIDGLPNLMVMFHGYVTNHQRVTIELMNVNVDGLVYGTISRKTQNLIGKSMVSG